MSAALSEAQGLVRAAIRDLSQAVGRGRDIKDLPPKTIEALQWHFKTTAREHVRNIHDLFTHIQDRLSQGLRIFSCLDTEGACTALNRAIPIVGVIPAAVAYTRPGDHPIVLCPAFFLESLLGLGSTLEQAVTMIHEAGHNAGLALLQPLPQLPREVYIEEQVYRALDAQQAMQTTDVFANFARDNVHGIPGRFAMNVPGELRAGVAISDDRPPQFVLSYGVTAEFQHPVLRILIPTASVELIYMPFSSQAEQRAMLAGTVGARLAARGEKIFLDLRAGVVVEPGRLSAGLTAALVEASTHFQPGSFDISAFFQAHRSLIEAEQNKIILGIGVDL
ncbi:M35 family metallo-endopeptidase [Cyanobium gracile]|uniref:Lysine-specific metallo-endopeptidase domain-containing protein n=1 Tax=Cyanobium gracile (strain ATCC 27147 / PCC 6307) TaxID=292564 RepID=K9P9C4_CYAGP|nr:M35 family metallo-endopeptidase [Cyanobium gracile]AFY29725.1 hypothetical protein Cyagr_2625 [Cyanobium gracile PCC 6307]